MSWHGVGRTAFACLLGGTLVNACHLIGGAGDLEFSEAAGTGGASTATTSADGGSTSSMGGSAGGNPGGGGAGGVVNPCDACTSEQFCVEEQCVECQGDTDCTDREKAHCDNTGTCVPCTDPSQCNGIANANICDDLGRCAECDAETQSFCASGTTCNLIDGRCDGANVGDLTACQPCSNSAQCGLGISGFCVQQEFQASPVGFYCLPTAQGGCGGTIPSKEPFLTPTGRPDVDGSGNETVCVMSNAANCIIHNAFLDGWLCDPGQPGMCGATLGSLQQVPGAVCALIGASYRCTYECGNASSCPRDMMTTASCGPPTSVAWGGTPIQVCGG